MMSTSMKNWNKEESHPQTYRLPRPGNLAVTTSELYPPIRIDTGLISVEYSYPYPESKKLWLEAPANKEIAVLDWLIGLMLLIGLL